jgi:hypothetical protein
MTKTQALKLMNFYAQWLRRDRLLDDIRDAYVRHLIGMPERVTDAFSDSKTMRWLGFMQGALWMTRRFTLEELKEHSREAAADEHTSRW